VKVRLLLALHFHQPVGNFDSVFEDAARLCYRPIVDHFERHPGVPAAFHLSGCLLEWLERRDRPLLDRIVRLVSSGRIEAMGGGFYEPILTTIPREDALDQIARLREYWRSRTGIEPRGAWIAERVWEPGLASLLAEAGVAYTILDDQHLRFAGLLDDRFSGLFVTEREAKPVGFFPSDFQLRYLIPFRPIETVRDHFRSLEAGGREWILTYGDDVEKFGFWPGTHRWVFEEGWLEKFLALLEEERGPVAASTPGSYFAERPPARKVYVPNASYTEMLEWALPAASAAAYGSTRRAALDAGSPPEQVRAFVRGSLWDMFLSRYPEADQLHKHVLWTSRRARALPAAFPGAGAAVTAALRAQCNCAYWHGLFGGLYFPHLRHGAYRNVLEADEILAREAGPGPGRVAVERVDLDGDLREEVILRTATTQAFLRPDDGLTLVELDHLPSRFNVTNIVSRWEESYHRGADQTHAPAADGALASPHEHAVAIRSEDLRSQIFDVHPLRGLRDFVSSAAPTVESLSRTGDLESLRGPIVSWQTDETGVSGRARLGAIEFRKRIALDTSGSLTARWDLEGPDEGAGTHAWLGTILCLSLLTPDAPDRARILESAAGRVSRGAPGDPSVEENAIRLTLEDRAFGFALDVVPDRPARLITAPIRTLQRSEDRYESTYQGTLVALCWPVGSGTGRLRSAGLSLTFRSLPHGDPPPDPGRDRVERS
jgi:4-alpha-glucanotransferase